MSNKIKTNKMFGNISIDDFLKNYWQKKPLLIRQAFPDFETVISPDELAGLSCEEEAESRLIIEKGLDGKIPWQVFNGPQDEDIFSQLPETNWTVLIQEANRHVPELQQYIDFFSFIPNWRFDDVMISFAPKDGSVGPHSDQYDVFLLQAEGQRHWHIANYETTDDDLIPDIDCRILKDFTSEQNWVLNPGDMLYLPPGVLHHGVAVNDCLTYSFGFKVGTTADLISGVIPYAVESGKLNNRFVDPDLTRQQSSGEITACSLDKMEKQLHELFQDKQLLRKWLAQYLTESRTDNLCNNDLETNLSVSEIEEYLNNGGELYRNEACRYAYIKTQDSKKYQLFINGEEIEVTPQLKDFIPILTGYRILDKQYLSEFRTIKGFTSFIEQLIGKEYLQM
jgi:50S ribosomal protein L16 3-hydroxylase